MRRDTQAQRELSTGFQQIFQQPETRSRVCDHAALQYNDRLVLDDLTPSDELISAVTAERERLDQDRTMLDEARGRLEAEIAEVLAQLADVAERRVQLARFLGEDATLEQWVESQRPRRPIIKATNQQPTDHCAAPPSAKPPSAPALCRTGPSNHATTANGSN